MAFPKAVSADLTRHPDTPADGVDGVAVTVGVEESGVLVLDYSLAADLSRLRIPSACAARVDAARAEGRADNLWRHTCFEAFLAPVGRSGYGELNFSPSLEWAMYEFSAYRQGMSSPPIGQPARVAVRRTDEGLALSAVVDLQDLAVLRDARHLRIALAAVVEAIDGRLSYWGLRHAPGKPDFHHLDGFVLELTR